MHTQSDPQMPEPVRTSYSMWLPLAALIVGVLAHWIPSVVLSMGSAVLAILLGIVSLLNRSIFEKIVGVIGALLGFVALLIGMVLL